MEVAVQRLDLFDDILRRLRRVAADLEQRQHQRGEFMPHRQAGEGHADISAGAADHEAGHALVGAGRDIADLVRQRGDFGQQLGELLRFGGGIERGDQFDRLANVDQVGRQLLLQIGVKHGKTPLLETLMVAAGRS